jgi:hypothetical protein
MKKGKIHLGNDTPSYDAWGKLVSDITFNNRLQQISISLQKENKVQRFNMSYQSAVESGFINLEVLDYYFNKF